MRDFARLHLGCGMKRLEGFINVDVRQSPAVDMLWDLTNHPWPWPNNSVEEIVCKHVVEHLWERKAMVMFLDECWRVLAPAGTLYLQVPDAADADLASADPTHVRAYRIHTFANYFTLPGIRRHAVTQFPWCWYVLKSENGIITAHGNPAKGYVKEV